MANASVPQNEYKIDSVDVEWEEQIYGESCAWARQRAEAYFAAVEAALYEQRPKGWRVIGERSRMVVTRFGEVKVKRRLYQDEEGGGRFLLDEYLGLPAQQLATASVMKAVLELSGEMGFAKAGKHLANLTAGVLSTATVWRLKEKVAQLALTAVEAEGKGVYEEGQRPTVEGKRKVERLFVEADGVFVRLQGEDAKHMEIKCGIAYEGWERLGDKREAYRLQGKRVYVHGHQTLHFWEGAGLAWSHYWDWRRVREVIVGGGGAHWIGTGTVWFEPSFWQVDGFHLARATRRALGREAGKTLFDLMRQGAWEAATTLWAETPKRKKKSAQAAIRWLTRLLTDHQGQDWRTLRHDNDETLRALGTMEGNIAHLMADRFKGQGRSWSRQGALHMAILRQLILHDELALWCRRQPHSPPPRPIPKKPNPKPVRDTESWLQVSLPAFQGPHADRPWARILKKRVHPYLPI